MHHVELSKNSSICQRCLYTSATVAAAKVRWLVTKHQHPVLLFVVELDAAEIAFLSVPCLLVKANHLVAQQTLAVRQLSLFQHDVISVVLHPGDEVHALLAQIGEPPVVQVAAIDGQQGPRLIAQLSGYSNLMLLALGDHRIAGEKTVVIQQQVQLDRPFGTAESRPIENAGAQIDHRRVHADQLVFEAELASARRLLHRQPPALGQKLLE